MLRTMERDQRAKLEELGQLPAEERIAALEELEARLRAELDADEQQVDANVNDAKE